MSGYPTSQVLYPPDLPTYLENVYKLKPIVGEPSDDEVIGIHAVIRVASKVVDVQGMGDPLLLARLSEHLFNAQMVKYRVKYLHAVFPEHTTYTPPALPAHVSVNLEPVIGIPSEESLIKVQTAIRSYQRFSDVPSMFDPRVNLELLQHLFDLHMARYTQLASQSQHVSPSQGTTRSSNPARATEATGDLPSVTNNVGTGAHAIVSDQTFQSAPTIDIRELLERSNQLAERFNQLLERSNELLGGSTQPTDQSNIITERFNQVLGRLTQLVEHSCRPAEQSNQLADRFNQLEPTNWLNERINSWNNSDRLLRAEYQLAAQTNQPAERLGDILRNINGVLVGIQHAIVRSSKGNTIKALDCLVNDRGETPAISPNIGRKTIGWFTDELVSASHRVPTVINGAAKSPLTPKAWLVGVPSDDEVIGIHAVVHAARKALEIPGMHDPGMIMKLGDHLFSAQLARYRRKYSLITFPSDATYTPPVLPTHIPANLDAISGAPSDDEIIKVQDAVQTCQYFRRFPSMFDACLNMELSQHLFDIQMARYMRLTGECTPGSLPQVSGPENPIQNREPTSNATGGAINYTNNAGTGAALTEEQASRLAPGIDIRELMERSNQLSDQFNKLLKRSNELMDRWAEPPNHSDSPTLTEQFNQVLERFTRVVEQSHQPAERSDRFAERFNLLFERLNHLIEQSTQPMQRVNELSDRANQLLERLNQSFERSNQLSEQANKSGERMADVLGDINRVLVGIQHAIVRNHKGNTYKAADCLVNERGDTPAQNKQLGNVSFEWLSGQFGSRSDCQFQVIIEGTPHTLHMDNNWLARLIRFFGVGEKYLEDGASNKFKEGQAGNARVIFGRYLSSCLG
ncbi:unnamed protein product [Rhizoctonia solani]|uniref:Laminin domain protein n=1 Tax=Rhizoctonia solani TaxID=456999 RepID=A0A8H3AE73_9AGAM|nr:unnamed protein product [Rhizoctonia solani]